MKNENTRIPALVVWFLGITGLVLSAGVILLTYFDKKIDGGLFTLAGTTVGALGAILTQTRTSGQSNQTPPPPQQTGPLEVVNPPGESLAVESADGATAENDVGEDSTFSRTGDSNRLRAVSTPSKAVQTNRGSEAANIDGITRGGIVD